MTYYLYINNAQYGPYTEEQMRAMIASGKVAMNTLVYQQGGAQNWQEAHKLPNLLKSPSKEAMALATDPSRASVPLGGKKEIERTLWEGRPSNLTIINFYLRAFFLICFFSLLTGYFYWFAQSLDNYKTYIFYIYIAFCTLFLFRITWVWINLKSTKWTLTTERFIYSVGLFSKRTENLELYRIKDLTLREPLFLRLFGHGYIDLITTDKSDPKISNIGSIKDPSSLYEMIRKYTERLRDQRVEFLE